MDDKILPRLAVAHGVITLEQALELTAEQEPKAQIDILLELFPITSGANAEDILRRVFEAYQSISDINDRWSALYKLTSHLRSEDEILIHNIRTQVQTLTTAVDAKQPSELMRFVARFSTKGTAQTADETMPCVVDLFSTFCQINRVYCLATLAKLLPDKDSGGLRDEALAIARTIKEGEIRASILASIAATLPEDERYPILVEALATIANEEDDECRSDLSIIIKGIPAEESALIQRAMQIVHTIQLAWVCQESIDELIDKTKGDDPVIVREILAKARSMSDQATRINISLSVMKYLDHIEQLILIRELRTVARSIDDLESKSNKLAEISTYLTGRERDELIFEAMKAAEAIDDETFKAQAYDHIVLALDSEDATLLDELLKRSRAFMRAHSRTRVFKSIAQSLPEPQQTTLYREAFELYCADVERQDGYETFFWNILSHISTDNQPLFDEVLEKALSYGVYFVDEVSFGSLLNRVSETYRQMILNTMLDKNYRRYHRNFPG